MADKGVDDEAPFVETTIQHLFNNMLYTDFTFVSKDGDKEFKAHKLILSIHSPVLRDIAYGTNFCNRIQIEDVSNAAIENMLWHLYGRCIEFENIYVIRDTKKLADRYEIPELGRKCRQGLLDVNPQVPNVISVLETAVEFENEALETKCLTLISQNAEEVFTSELFMVMEFENVLQIFEKLRDRQLITEDMFLHSAIQWLETNGSLLKKNLLMAKIKICKLSLKEFLFTLMSFPRFFSNIEISLALTEIMFGQEPVDKSKIPDIIINPPEQFHESESSGTNTMADTELYRSIGINTVGKSVEHRATETNTGSAPFYRSMGTNTELESEACNALEKACNPPKMKQLTLRILKEEAGNNPHKLTTRVRAIIQDEFGSRSFHFGPTEIDKRKLLTKGIFGNMSQESDYNFYDVDLSYEGLYYFTDFWSYFSYSSPRTPVQHIEILKAANFYKIEEASQRIIGDIKEIVTYDPLFLDGLRRFRRLKERCLQLLVFDTFQFLIHPNLIKSSYELLMLMLQQKALHLDNETVPLICIIIWLEAGNRYRWHFRRNLLKHIAFESISITDLKYIEKFHAGFFSFEEINSIFNYKNAAGTNVASLKVKLPEWYNFKSRKYLGIKLSSND